VLPATMYLMYYEEGGERVYTLQVGLGLGGVGGRASVHVAAWVGLLGYVGALGVCEGPGGMGRAACARSSARHAPAAAMRAARSPRSAAAAGAIRQGLRGSWLRIHAPHNKSGRAGKLASACTCKPACMHACMHASAHSCTCTTMRAAALAHTRGGAPATQALAPTPACSL